MPNRQTPTSKAEKQARNVQSEDDWSAGEFISFSEASALLNETLRRLHLEANADLELVRALKAGDLLARAQRHEFGFWNALHSHPPDAEVPRLFWEVWEWCPVEHRSIGDAGFVWFSDVRHRVFEGVTGVTVSKPQFERLRARIGGGGAGGRPRTHRQNAASAAVALQLSVLTDSDLERETGPVVGTRVSEWYVGEGLTPPSETTLDSQGNEILAQVWNARRQ